MRRWIGLGLAAVLAVAVVGAIVVSVAQKIHPAVPLTVVRGGSSAAAAANGRLDHKGHGPDVSGS
jgi:hypothetical protein